MLLDFLVKRGMKGIEKYVNLRQYIKSGDILLYKPYTTLSRAKYTKARILTWNEVGRLETIGIGERSRYVSDIIRISQEWCIIKPIKEEYDKSMAVIDTMESKKANKVNAAFYYLWKLKLIKNHSLSNITPNSLIRQHLGEYLIHL